MSRLTPVVTSKDVPGDPDSHASGWFLPPHPQPSFYPFSSCLSLRVAERAFLPDILHLGEPLFAVGHVLRGLTNARGADDPEPLRLGWGLRGHRLPPEPEEPGRPRHGQPGQELAPARVDVG